MEQGSMPQPQMDVMLAPSRKLVLAPVHALVHLKGLMVGHFVCDRLLDGIRALLDIF